MNEQSNPSRSEPIRSFLDRPGVQEVLVCLLIAGAVLLAYGNTLHASFHLDDLNITDAPNLRMPDLSWQSIRETFYGIRFANPGIDRPVAYLSFGLNYYFGGPDVIGFHIVNIAIHMAAAILLFFLVRTTLRLPSLESTHGRNATGIALFSALLWALHPIQTQAVTYIIQRMTSMAALFFLASMLCFVATSRNRGWKRGLAAAGTVAFALLALGTKEHTVLLPVVMGLYYRFFLRPPVGAENAPRQWRRYGAAILVVVLCIGGVWLLGGQAISNTFSEEAGGFFHQHTSKGFSPYERLISQPRVLFHYLGLLAHPSLSRFNAAYYDFPKSVSLLSPPTTLLAIAGVIGLIAGAVFLRRRTPLLSFAVFWFFLNSAVEASFLVLFMYFEHRVYLPSMWLFVPLAAAAFRYLRVRGGQLPAVLALSAVTLALLILTVHRNRVWQDEYTLWADVVAKSPGSAVAHSHYGNALLGRGQLDEAITQYATALRLAPCYGDAYTNLGLAYLQKGSAEHALEMFRMALRCNWGFPYGLRNTYRALGMAYLQLGRQDEAQDAFAKAQAIIP